MPARIPPRRSRLRRFAFATAIGFAALLAFGISGADESAYRSFDEAAGRWQHAPEFRAVAIQYCELGSRAMRTRPLFIPAKREIMALRSLPMLPATLAVNPTSRQHYEDFSRGPLSSYLHLCGEQQLDPFIQVFEGIGQRPNLGEADSRELLDSFHMDFPVCKDPGAIRSAADVLRESEAYRKFAVRQNIDSLLLPEIADLSRDLHFPPDPVNQTPDQQQAVLDRLDAFVRQHDPELWRTKQVSDFCGGVWAQVFSPPYTWVLRPAVLARETGQIALVFLLLGQLVLTRRRPTAA